MENLRLGCLGAARIAPSALIRPARATDGVEVRAIAARDPAKAQAFATKHGIPVVHRSYEELLADPDIDAIYNPLPNGLHGVWTRRALDAGKHVLCEKPFTANAVEAAGGLVTMEAFHWRYHPLAARIVEVARSGSLGTIQRIEAALCFPLPRRHDIRWQLDLAGGALMDAGCYPVHIVRSLAAGLEPTVTSATARLRSPGIDRYMQAELAFADGSSGQITCSMWSASILRLSAKVTGSAGTMRVFNPQSPHYFNRLTIKTAAASRHERVAGGPTYDYQMAAFVAAVRHGAPILTPPSDSVANMAVIDAIYRAAGLEPRPAAGA